MQRRHREIKRTDGSYVLLEVPEYTPSVLIKDGVVVNEEGYRTYLERKKQNAVAPTSTPPDLAEQTRSAEESLKDEKYKALETKVDDMSSTLHAILAKLNEKN